MIKEYENQKALVLYLEEKIEHWTIRSDKRLESEYEHIHDLISSLRQYKTFSWDDYQSLFDKLKLKYAELLIANK